MLSKFLANGAAAVLGGSVAISDPHRDGGRGADIEVLSPRRGKDAASIRALHSSGWRWGGGHRLSGTRSGAPLPPPQVPLLM